MNTMFEPLESDDDVILLDNDAFTVSRLKDLLKQQINKRFTENQNIFSINFFTLPIGHEVKIELNDIQLCNLSRDCKLLKVGSKGWQKGKLRIQVDKKILHPHQSHETQISLEFCPDEPTVPESPLDDLRQLPEYKQQS
ncbi:KGK family protein [Microcoleus sp. FACHB-SPT15]|uniref:KGK domain-containing protein n=1 Tax=Microcoleus sp. FACHB-SPT15 TaxID=2692830 RepID=UPI001784C352|nr:KGK domain-containing protein [Microcoleus sp. FACHB-SPT15]MBD1809972.1 KGK family protein [Microcoleus sp. FACHB-SPT15]